LLTSIHYSKSSNKRQRSGRPDLSLIFITGSDCIATCLLMIG
jgi:hypothetical protein